MSTKDKVIRFFTLQGGLMDKLAALFLYGFIIMVCASIFFNFDAFQWAADELNMDYGFATLIVVLIWVVGSYILHFLFNFMYRKK